MGVDVAGLRCAYGRGRPPAVEIESLALAGGVCALVGINGAGKSTLLRTLAGCRRPEVGTVRIDGVDLYGGRRRDVVGRIGYLPQQLDLPRELRVADALDYASWVRGVARSTARERNPGILDDVGLAARRRARWGELSGGMRRRLALAVALVTDPDVLLLDEPTTGLDPEQRVALREILGERVRSGSATLTLLSSHVMEDVALMADRIVVLDEARVLYDGAVADFVAARGGPDRSAEHAFLATLARARG